MPIAIKMAGKEIASYDTTTDKVAIKLSDDVSIKDSAGNVVLNESGGVVTLNNGTIGSGVVFPAGHIIQFAQSFTKTGGGVIGVLNSVGSGSPATLLTATINNVLASSKVFGFFYTGAMVLNFGQSIYNNVSGGGGIDTDYYNQSGSGNGGSSPTFFFYDDAPGTGTNSYVITGYSNASGNAAYWCSNGGFAYGWMLFEVAQ